MQNKPGSLSVDTTRLISPLLAGATRRGLDEVVTLGGVVATGGMGRIHRASNLNPFALLAELVINGELAPSWCGVDGVPFEEPGPDELPDPILDPGLVKRIYAGADRLRGEFEKLTLEHPEQARRNRLDLLAAISPRLASEPRIAVKILQPVLPEGGDDTTRRRVLKDQTRRFIRENHILRQLDHPGIVSRFGLVFDPERGWCLLLAYIDGENLEERLQREPGGRLPLKEAARLALEVAEALKHIHARRIVHRDIKPSNIMIDVDGRAVITDFGIGKWEVPGATVTENIVGTLDYLAPEQLEGRATAATDIYQLGTTLFRTVTGHLPYAGFEQAAFFTQLGNADADHPSFVHQLRPGISPEFETIIEVARRKKAEERWTLDELIGELRSLARFESDAAPAGDRTAFQRKLKGLSWERWKVETQLQCIEIDDRLAEVEDLASGRRHTEALGKIEAIFRDVQALPSRFNATKAKVMARRQAIAQAIPHQEALRILDLANRCWAAGDFTGCGAALREVGRQLADVPPGSWPEVRVRQAALLTQFKPMESFIQVFETLHRSLIDGILSECRDLNRDAASGRTVNEPRIEKLLKDVHTAVGMLRSIDRSRIGPAYDRAAQDLADRWMELKGFVEMGKAPEHFDSSDARTTVRSWVAQCRLALEELRGNGA